MWWATRACPERSRQLGLCNESQAGRERGTVFISARQKGIGLVSCEACFDPAAARRIRSYGSVQLVLPPPIFVNAPRVAGNCGWQLTSVPLRLPVILLALKLANDRS